MQRHHERAAETGAEQDTQAVACRAPDTKCGVAMARVQGTAEDAAGRKPESAKINERAGA